MILKKLRKNDFILGKLCLFSNEKIEFNNSDTAEYTYFLYVVSGELTFENSNKTAKVTAGSLIDHRMYGDIFFKVKADKHGAICLLIMTDPREDYTDICYNCKFINNINYLKIAKNSMLFSLVDSLKIYNNDRKKVLQIPLGSIVQLLKNKEYTLEYDKEYTDIALLIDR